jgi:hypothetical protein
MKGFAQIGTDIGALVEKKNAAYGSSFAVAGDFLRLLFPDGIPVESYNDALLLVRIFDKQMRIATDKDAFGESPYLDIGGYGVLGVHHHEKKKESTTWQGSASAPDASSSPKAQPASADRSTNERTTTSASATTGGELLQQLKDSLALCEDAPAETATETVAVSSVDRAVRSYRRDNFAHSYTHWLHRHNNLKCIACEASVMGKDKFTIVVHTPAGITLLALCSASCGEWCELKVESGTVKGASYS